VLDQQIKFTYGHTYREMGVTNGDVRQLGILLLQSLRNLNRAYPNGKIVGIAGYTGRRKHIATSVLIPFDVGVITIVHRALLANLLVKTGIRVAMLTQP